MGHIETPNDAKDKNSDGLGDFRHSSSFNDLSSLLSPDEKQIELASSAGTFEKKRGKGNSAPESARKRQATTKNKKTDHKKESEIQGEENDAADTPNPLGPTEDYTDEFHDDSSLACSESDFKSIARAAVSNLIANAASEKETTLDTSEKVDTSTAHVKALTGNNWVTACAGAQTGTIVVSANDPKGNNRNRRQNLTPDERARQNRDRNREHARNTRLRKKAYVEELKRTLTEMVAQRDASELEKKQANQRELEQREVRFRVMEELLKLRGRNEANEARWAAIFEDGFTLSLPVTHFRKMAKTGEDMMFEQELIGPKEAMDDAECLHEFLLSLGSQKEANSPALIYECDRKKFLMDGCTAALDWTATAPLVHGSLKLKGNLRCQFSPSSNKLITATLLFDTGVVQHQVASFSRASSPVAEGLISEEAKFAAEEANAIIDSIQVPGFSSVPTAVNVVPSSASSSSSADDVHGDKMDSADEHSVSEGDKTDAKLGMSTRRVTRRNSPSTR